MGRKRYLFFDIDGTLLAGGPLGYVPESTKLAVKKLKEAGHFLAIATGRAQFMGAPYMQLLGMENMVSDGGNGITIDGELIGIEPLNKADVVALVRECEERGFPWGLAVDNSDVRLVPDGRFYEATHDNYIKCRIVPGLDPEDQEIIYKAYVVCREPEEYTLESLKKLPWCRYMPEYFFVEPTEKAVGIRRMMDYYHADYSDAIVFGDGANDLTMFTDDWTKVAMGNAIPELKAKADYVTTDVDQDGIYNACLALGLFEE
ncbi:MAG: HAD hydrolase family protein [Oscillospiraceae bacterium]|nr:HAD hydrolase family protein [Oscillospiraceae bacterium]